MKVLGWFFGLLLGFGFTAPVVSGQVAREVDGSMPVVAPCDPVVDRTVDRRVAAVGESIEVGVTWRYACKQRKKRAINVIFVVENTEALRGNGVHRKLLDNLKHALTDFVTRMDYDEGSYGGLSLYARDYTYRVPLRGGREGQVALLQGIRGISVEPIGNSAGAPAAIRDATERLPTHTDEEPTNVLIVVDAGAPVATKPLIDYPSACGAAHDAGVVLVVVGLAEAGSRGSGCASPGWYRGSHAESGSDLKEIFVGLADSLMTQGKRVAGDEYHEWPSAPFAYEPGSGDPRDPDYDFAGQLGWYSDDGGTRAERNLRYRLRIAENAEPGIVPLSESAGFSLFFEDATQAEAPADNPTICIYSPEDPSVCDNFPPPDGPLPSPTAQPPATATAPPASSTVPPTVPPTAAPEVTPTVPAASATPRASVWRVLLPVAYREAR